jgi:hypothetical protein
MHDSAPLTQEQVSSHVPWLEPLILQALPADPPRQKPGQRGRPQHVSWGHLWFRLIIGLLGGMRSYQDLRRDLAEHPLGPFPRCTITDDALVKRLKQAGIAPLHTLFQNLSDHLGRWLTSLLPCTLAPFASAILALDETTWDAVERHLPALRQFPRGDRGLLPGKLAARFNLRTQLFDFVQFRDDPLGNCKRDVCSLLAGVPVDALLLFDLGYFSFAWLDYLSECRYWFISRIPKGVQYQIAHRFYRHHGTLDALVWLGTTGRNSSRTARLVRLVQFWDGQNIRQYLTNQLDPALLPLPDIARLYARRWDIELAFLTLKEHLGLHHWWSALPVLRQQQALLVLIAAQLLHALRLLLALEQGRDPFEVSLPLLVQALPRLIAARQHPVVWACRYGHEIDLFRPSSRCALLVPDPPLSQYLSPPADLPTTRRGAYLVSVSRPKRSPSARRRAQQARPPASCARQLSLFPARLLRQLREVNK